MCENGVAISMHWFMMAMDRFFTSVNCKMHRETSCVGLRTPDKPNAVDDVQHIVERAQQYQ